MSLKRNEVNPLSVLGLRKLNFIPEHFEKIAINNKSLDTKFLENWINYNLNGRYAIIKNLILDNNKMIEVIEIGLEDHKEMSMLTLGCPYLHKI